MWNRNIFSCFQGCRKHIQTHLGYGTINFQKFHSNKFKYFTQVLLFHILYIFQVLHLINVDLFIKVTNMARQYYYEHQAAIFRLASKDFDTK